MITPLESSVDNNLASEGGFDFLLMVQKPLRSVEEPTHPVLMVFGGVLDKGLETEERYYLAWGEKKVELIGRLCLGEGWGRSTSQPVI